MDSANLAERTCLPCTGATPRLGAGEAARLMAGLHPDWRLDQEATRITRRIAVKGFDPAVQIANVVGWLAGGQDHHPDIALGWGHCTVTWWTHAIGGLSEADFICAAKLDRLLAQG
mgnify:CR=1 FL=1